MKRYACILLLFHFLFVSGDDTQTMLNLSMSLPPSSSNGNRWNTSDKNPCLWPGVGCNSGDVTSLSLSGLGLITSPANHSSALAFFKLVCDLPSLQSLDLSSNSFAFVPPSFFSNCSGCKALNFSSNSLNIPLVNFSRLSNLEVLDLSSNMLQGEVGAQLEGLRKLETLNLRNNMIGGNIPREISELKNLTFLDLSMNNLSGSIPDKIGMLSKLNVLALSSNILDGKIPREISQLKNLTFLDLSINMLSGSIPGKLSQLKNLTFLDLSMNNLSGSIPDEIVMLSKLNVLVLSANNLEGPIPSNLSSAQSLQRFAANQNKFTGPIPSGITRGLKFLDLSYNQLNGKIPSDLLSPPTLESVDLSSNMLQGHIPGSFSQKLVRLRLGGNNLTGIVPSFTQSPSLTYLELDNNSLVGEIPSQLAKCPNLALLNLARNRLQGPLPKELGSLSELVIMKLQENNLIGEIPNEFSNLTQLITLNLSRNSFSGPIPSSITNLGWLQNLNLASNMLDGLIPSNIGMLNRLIELQLGNNQLSGTLPRMPTSLTALNLSSNHFSGSIPSLLADISLLEILDLSDNSFTGEVPSYLARMQSLTLLVLSNNQLSGTLPAFTNHVSVLWAGNSGLVDPKSAPETSLKRRDLSAWIIVLIIVGAIIIGASLASAIVYLALSKRFHRVEDFGLQLEEGPQVINGCYITSDIIHRSNIDFTKAMEAVGDPTNIMFKTRFSTYYKAVMPSGSSYTVKKLNWSEKIFQVGSGERFGQQLQVLGRLSNSNVMVPLAYVLTRDTAYLIYDHVPKGTVFEFLHQSSENALDWQSRYSIALGVAQGLTFLHGCTQPVFLLDLSTKSIHLKSMKEPRIGDIELCKVIDPSKSTGSLSTVAGSVGYIPPEYAYTMRVTAAGNVYSFGVVLLELLTGKPPVSEGVELARWALGISSRLGQGEHILDSRVSGASPEVRRQMMAVWKVALSCVSLSPGARPKMRNVLRSLFNAR